MANLKLFTKGVKVKITANFSSTEFDCQCKRPDCKVTVIDIDHVKRLQVKRDKWQKSITINSAYRCKEHNAATGGESLSRHMVSDATDITVKGMTPDQVADDCEDFDGLGRYASFVHVDSRGYKSRWDFRTVR